MNTPNSYSEEFLQYVWENKICISKKLKTTKGEPLEIINVGKRNSDSGPDFFNAKIKIKETVWVGNIEIHKKSSDWEKHNHQNDKAYNNVILHVVEEDDHPIRRNSNEIIPTLILNYPNQLRINYQNLLNAKTWKEVFSRSGQGGSR